MDARMTERRSARLVGGAAAAALAAALLLPARGLPAQEGADARWLPWLGCWTEVGGAGDLLCVRPSGVETGVELLTVRDGRIEASERLRADGVARETSREGCKGTESAAFSSDGRRLYLRSDFSCEGDVARRGTGIVAMVGPTEWVRVETVEVAGKTAAVTERYREAPATPTGLGLEDLTAGREMAVNAARRAGAVRPSVDDLIEASRHVDAEAVATWVAERGEPLEVDAGRLVRLADAGVAEEVVDVVVAVSFPERFAVDRDARGDAGRRTAGTYRGPFRTPYLGRSTFGPYHYGYSPFGFPGYGWWYGTRSPTVVVIRPRDGDAEHGRVVDGRGYTRSSPTGEPAAPAAGAQLPSGSSVSPSGMNSGGSSGSTGRKAKPRGSSSGDGGPGDDGTS